jgi:hypothetical protein
MSSTTTDVPLQDISAVPALSSDDAVDEFAAATIPAPPATTPHRQNIEARTAQHGSRIARLLRNWLGLSAKTNGGQTAVWNAVLTVVGLTLTVAGLIYGYEAYRLQQWTSIKDYFEYCKDNVVSVVDILISA